MMRKKPLKFNVYFFKEEGTFDIINSNSVRIRSDQNGLTNILYNKKYYRGQLMYSASTLALCNEYIGLQTPVPTGRIKATRKLLINF